jgi:cysteinyl-tRNA synthetase
MSKSKGNVLRVTDLAERGIDPLSYRLLCFGTRYRSEMHFSWEALRGENSRLTNLRQRMAEWSPDPRSDGMSLQAEEFDRRFRDAVASDLDMPAALVVLNDAVSSKDVGSGEKYALLASWDDVLGLDLERMAREGFEIPDVVHSLIRERDAARASADFARSDAIRDQLATLGWEVMDTPEGTKVRPRG